MIVKKPIVTAETALAMCDYSRARRNDPTPEQIERACLFWHKRKDAPAPRSNCAEWVRELPHTNKERAALFDVLRELLDLPNNVVSLELRMAANKPTLVQCEILASQKEG